MKKLKEKIRNAYESETPDQRASVLTACEQAQQLPAPQEKAPMRPPFFRRLATVLACAVVFAVGLCVGRLTLGAQQPAAAEATCVYLDVNPSLTLSLDEKNTVLSCTANNEDAEKILNGMQLGGVEVNTALNAIVGAMYVNGYLTQENNSMLISVDSSVEADGSTFLSYLTEQVNAVFANAQMECAIIAQSVTADEDLKRRAEENGVSVGKMHLLDKMIEDFDDLTQEDISNLSGMSIGDLNLIYSQKDKDGHERENEVISGEVNVGVSRENALSAVLAALSKEEADVEAYEVCVLPSRHQQKSAVYAVTLKLVGEDTTYRFEVDCRTGEVTETPSGDHREEEKDEHYGGDLPPEHFGEENDRP